MQRLISSLLVFLLGTAASPVRRVRPRAALRPRRTPDDDGATDRSLEASERPRARARQLRRSWSGSVEIMHPSHTVQIPGTWTLDSTPFHRHDPNNARYEVLPLPDISRDREAWAARIRTVLSLQEPGTRVRVGTVDASGWKTLELAMATQPPTIVEVDRAALGVLLDGAVTVRLKIEA